MSSYSRDAASVHAYVKIDSSQDSSIRGETLEKRRLRPSAAGRQRKRDGEQFAVKKLAKNKDTKSTYGKSWENEIRVLRRFQHANIVQLEIIFESESNCYLFMELCDAGTLADELKQKATRSEAAKLPPKSPLLPEAAATEGQTSSQPSQPRRRTTFQPPARSNVKLTDFGLSIELRCLEHSLVDNVGTPVYQGTRDCQRQQLQLQVRCLGPGIIANCMLHGGCPYDDSDDLTEAIRCFNYAEACADC
uniref:Protein kinase domain-containing protein n=1 Tax=Macrostomum lignano TaxID=282301 RepID=A0A1I8F947_9PLAT